MESPVHRRGIYLLLLQYLFVFQFSVQAAAPLPSLRNGNYRAVLTRPDGNRIVFGFEVKDSAARKIIYVINAEERLLVDSVSGQGDSIFIQMPFFDSWFRAVADRSGNLRGQWIKKLADRNLVLPFEAFYNEIRRFPASQKPLHDVSGRWDVSFTGKNKEVTKAVGEFSQKGNSITGTFLTTTGDYRFLEGAVDGDSLMLSAFDGGHAFLFTARVNDDTTISNGHFFTGESGKETWEARRDNKAELPDGYAQTALHAGETKLRFTFTSMNGEHVSLTDTRFKNKVVIIQLLGSWCPNCMDETAFLSEYYSRNKEKGIEVIGLAYERTTDYETSKKSLSRFIQRLNVQYPVLITGVAVSDPKRTEKTLPQITPIKAFPTSIFIDKKGIVRKIYSGFNGPGTGEHFRQFREEFEATISGLLQEP